MSITINKETLLIDGGDASPLSLSWQLGDPYRKAVFDALVAKYLALETTYSDLVISAEGFQAQIAQLTEQLAGGVTEEPAEPQAIRVSNAQGRIILQRAGVFDVVVNILNTLPNEQERVEALLKFEYEPYMHSDNALVNLVLGDSEIGLGYTKDQIRQLFLDGQGL